jgi:hypothetical protein
LTWTKHGDEFCDQLARADLTDAAFRTHVEAIAWIYRVEALDLRIPKRLVRRIATSDDYETAVKELAAVRFWRDRGEHWEVLHHGEVIRQSIQQQRAKKARDLRAKRAERRRKVSVDVSADSSAAVTGDTDRQTDAFHGGSGAAHGRTP